MADARLEDGNYFNLLAGNLLPKWLVDENGDYSLIFL